MSFRNFVLKRSYVDMDYVYGTLSNKNGENPLNYKKMQENPMNFTIVAMDATTGKPVYFNKSNISQDHYDVFKASSSLPFICKPYFIDNIPYYDGGVGDPIPLQKAFDEGCDKVIIILTKPKDFIRNSRQDTRISKFIEKKYPNSAKKLRKRADNYNKTLKLAKKYEKENKVLIIAPDSTCGVKTLTKDLNALNILYKKGYKDAEKIKEFIK